MIRGNLGLVAVFLTLVASAAQSRYPTLGEE